MVVAALFVGCTTDVTDKDPEMTDIGDIEVTFSVDGEEVSRLDLRSVSHTIKVDVALNNDNIFWRVVSNQEWCHIVEEPHRGSGSFTLEIEANDSFETRERATIKFVAGEYEEDMLIVDHNGNVFLLEQVYAVATQSAGSFTTKVKTFDTGDAWEFDCEEWITATKVSSTTNAEGETITEVTITWEANTDASRYGEVKLVKDGKDYADGKINIWQYGTEYEYDAEGKLLLDAQDVAPLELRVPENLVKSLVLPNWVSATEPSNNGNGTVSYMLSFTDNPSDAKFIRPSRISIEVLTAGVDAIELPEIRQNYYPVGGLLTGVGLQLFAKTWNEGGNLSDWCIDGVPTIVGDVDMSLVEEWIPIGTPEKPFSGKFNGAGYKIQYFESTQPLFGYCEGAEISNIVIDASCTFAQVGDFAGTINLAPLAYKLTESSEVSKCVSYANVTVDGNSTVANYISHLGGLVVEVEEGSTVSECSFYGTITTVAKTGVNISAKDTSNSHVGGIVAKNSGTVKSCHSEGVFNFNAYSNTINMGGIVGTASAATSVIDSNKNLSTINYASARMISGINDISRYAYIGGIVGGANGTISNNNNKGDVISTSDIKLLNIGGIAGLVNQPNVVFQHNSVANEADLKSLGGARYPYIGSLIGYLYENLDIDFTDDLGDINGTIYVTAIESATSTAVGAGGIVGYLDGSKGAKLNLTAPKWGGKITIDLRDGNHSAAILCGGGIVGYATGEVTITGAESNGDNILIQVETGLHTLTGPSTLGGIVGYSTSAVKISNSTNNTPVLWNTNNKKSNNVPAFAGGVVGCLTGNGESSITNCHNTANVTNLHYNNNAYTGTNDTFVSTACATGGIIGSFGQYKGTTGKLTLSGCTNIGTINAYRACVGGIAGYLNRANCDGCSFTIGHIGDNESSYAGGIVGFVTASTISNSWVKANIKSTQAGSCGSRGGGIAALSVGEVTIDACKFFGTLTNGTTALNNADKVQYAGGVVGVADAGCNINNCQFGGQFVNELDSNAKILINATNFTDYAVGTTSPINEMVITNIGYWDGSVQ